MLSLVNVINRLMWSQLKIPFTISYSIKATGYVITFGPAQSYHIKRLPLYFEVDINPGNVIVQSLNAGDIN